MLNRIRLLACFAAFIVVHAAQGQTPASGAADSALQSFTLSPAPLLAAQTPPPSDPFSKGSIALELEAAYTDPIRFSTDQYFAGAVGLSYYFADNWSASIRAHGFAVQQEFGDDTTGGGASILLRWHFLRSENWSLYIDGGGGLAWSNDPIPFGGTTYNYTGRAGGGVSFRVTDHIHLLAGARYFHLSNANQHGRQNNPSFDGVEYYVGMMFTLR